MAVIVRTATPKGLLAKIKEAIDEEHIDTWTYDKNGFTHETPDKQWANKAWLRPIIGSGVVKFNFIGNPKITTSAPLYGVYHGRFIEMLLSHFDTEFEIARATSQAVSGDIITP